MSKAYQAKLILLGRESLPEESDWDYHRSSSKASPGIREKIEKIREIEEGGGKVLYFSCDISNENQFVQILRTAENQLGKINGVFHTAGLAKGPSINSLDQLRQADFPKSV